MKKEYKTSSQIRAEKEKFVMENFKSVMKKLDATFLVESEKTKDIKIPFNDKKMD